MRQNPGAGKQDKRGRHAGHAGTQSTRGHGTRGAGAWQAAHIVSIITTTIVTAIISAVAAAAAAAAAVVAIFVPAHQPALQPRRNLLEVHEIAIATAATDGLLELSASRVLEISHGAELGENGTASVETSLCTHASRDGGTSGRWVDLHLPPVSLHLQDESPAREQERAPCPCPCPCVLLRRWPAQAAPPTPAPSHSHRASPRSTPVPTPVLTLPRGGSGRRC